MRGQVFGAIFTGIFANFPSLPESDIATTMNHNAHTQWSQNRENMVGTLMLIPYGNIYQIVCQ